MSNAIAAFKGTITMAAESALATLAPEDRDRAISRFLVAFQQAAASSKSPGKLYSCAGTPQGKASIARAVYTCHILDLYPGGPLPDMWLIPRGGQVHAEPSFRGLRRLLERQGCVVQCRLVFAGETFALRNDGAGEVLTHHRDPWCTQTWDTMMGGYVTVTLPSGRTYHETLDKMGIEERRSKAMSQNVWNSWPLEMAQKTVILYALRRGLPGADITPEIVEVLQQEAATTVLTAPPPRQITSSTAALGSALDELDDGLMLDVRDEGGAE